VQQTPHLTRPKLRKTKRKRGDGSHDGKTSDRKKNTEGKRKRKEREDRIKKAIEKAPKGVDLSVSEVVERADEPLSSS